MKLIRYLAVSFDSIFAHKLRAGLTMLGIIIGIAAVLITVGIGSGAAASITERIEANGANLITVSAGASRNSTGGSALTLADAAVLADRDLFPAVATVAPLYSANATLTYGSSDGSYTVVGATPAYAAVRNLELAAGAFLSEEQVAANASVAVLGDTVAGDLFGGDDPLGQTFRIGDSLFTVAGVLEESGASGFGSSDTQVFVPIGVAQGRLFDAARRSGSYALTSLLVQGVSGEVLDDLELQIEQILRLRHRLNADDENDFQIQNQTDMLEMASDVSGTLSALLGGIGAVSLLVGGIGIMNIMLVSVTERTSEIGLRRALGAHDGDILLQFLVEALVLCTLGGLAGIGLSYGVEFATAALPSLPLSVVIAPWSVGLALAVSMASGFVFGLYPALRATRLDPIEALRYE